MTRMVRVDLTMSEAAAVVDDLLNADYLTKINQHADRDAILDRAADKIRRQLKWVQQARVQERSTRA